MAKTNHSRRGGSCGGSCSPVFRSRRSVCVWGSVCAVVWHGYFRVNINYVCCMPAAIHESTRRKVCYIEVAPCVCVCVCVGACVCVGQLPFGKTGNRMLLPLQFDIIDACRTRLAFNLAICLRLHKH